ncbi:MAG: hypothetical protein JXR37_19275 [Kiritimatiellae bacterium]|nr:hypothetical protein [Kiritimatiellia bacterium]
MRTPPRSPGVVVPVACAVLIHVAAVLSPAGAAPARTVQAWWDANPEPDMREYRLHWGTVSRGSATHPAQFAYPNQKTVGLSATPTATVSNLADAATYYFAITAVDTSGNESGYSREAVAGPGVAFVAYNDLAWFAGERSANITCYSTTNANETVERAGHLVDRTTGATLPVSVVITGGDAAHTNQGAHPSTGDAASVFDGNVDCAGCVGYATDDLVLTFGGLDPTYRYEFVLYSDRNSAGYTGESARYHVGSLAGAAAFRNVSTPGTTRRRTTVPDDTTVYNAGYNNPLGYVTRFANVDPGSDGTVELRVRRDAGQSDYTYANAFMVRAQPAKTTAVAREAAWHYRKGTAEASNPPHAWRLRGFDDTGWTTGDGPFGYSSEPAEGPFNTPLDDMSAYTSLYLRRPFVVEEPARVTRLLLWAESDDGFIVWVNGRELGRVNVAGVAGTFVAHDGVAQSSTEPAEWTLELTGAAMPEFVAGTNMLAVHAFNSGTGSSDFKIDMALELGCEPRSAAEDADADGLPDDWETAYLSGVPGSPDADPDGDGLSNAEEYIAGTDPLAKPDEATQGEGGFGVELELIGGNLVVSFQTVAAAGPGYAGYTRRYALESRPAADADASWSRVPGYADITGDGRTVTYTDTTGNAYCYRARVWLAME